MRLYKPHIIIIVIIIISSHSTKAMINDPDAVVLRCVKSYGL